MSKEKQSLLPSLRRSLATLGEQIRLARLRRRFPAAMVAERAGISRNTLRAIERGDPSVSIGNYASTLLTLNLENDLKLIAKDDELGRKLQDAHLPIKMKTRVARRVSKLKKKTDE